MMEYVSSAALFIFKTCAWIVLFPFIYVLIPIIRFCFGIVNHFILIPIFLVFRTIVYGFIYIPLVPVLSAANVKYDKLVPVEVTIYRLCVASITHINAIIYHFIHFFMVSLLVGSFVGMIVGINISLVSRIIRIPETKGDSSMKRTIEFKSSAPEWKKAKHEVQQEKAMPALISVKSEVTDQNQLSKSSPKVKVEQGLLQGLQMPQLSEFSRESIFEDDDGYNFMTYKMSDERRKQMQREQIAKRRESRHKSVTQSLHTTIEEESESEITPTPMLAVGTETPTNHVSLDYATGTIGSLKTFSAESSVFSKTNLSGPRTDIKEEEESIRKRPLKGALYGEDKVTDDMGSSPAEKSSVDESDNEDPENVSFNVKENEFFDSFEQESAEEKIDNN